MIKNLFFKKNVILGLAFLFAFFCAYSNWVDARPGGGHSSRSSSSGNSNKSGSNSSGNSNQSGSNNYSGGSSHTPSNQNNEGAELFFQVLYILLVLAFGEKGAAMVIVLVVLIILLWVLFKNMNFSVSTARNRNRNRSSNSSITYYTPPKPVPLLAGLLEKDPAFSETLFLDYAQLVVHSYYNMSTEQDAIALKPYFYNNQLLTRTGYLYKEVVINAIYIKSVDIFTQNIVVALSINYTEMPKDKERDKQNPKRFAASEEWTFIRNPKLQSLPPAKMRALVCLACGASDTFKENHRCGACGVEVLPAAHQWAVSEYKNICKDFYQMDTLVAYEPESGTNLSTKVAVNLDAQLEKFAQVHQIKDINAYLGNFSKSLVAPMFETIYTAWTNQTWENTRHLVSDAVYETQDFWMHAYKQKGYINHLEQIKISKTELVKVDIDKYYEAFTVRIFASCLDYTVDKNGAFLGGNKHYTRAFSEYWTFIRRAGVETQKKDEWAIFANCPACAAPLDKMGMSGECGYCSNKVSTGEFSWVLSRITQDEAYF